MLDQFFKKVVPKSSKGNKNAFMRKFYGHQANKWITEDKHLKRMFDMLFDSFDNKISQHFFNEKPLIVVQSTGILSCTLSSLEKNHVIILFPQLIRYLKSGSPLTGIAVIAHELGHIYYGHSHREIDTLEAQVQADAFAVRLGFGHELQDVLLDYNASTEVKVRISRLTSQLLTQDN